MTERTLEGRTVLLVEDEYFQAMDAKRVLQRAGAEVLGPTGHAEQVPALLEDRSVDAAVIDINLGYGPTYAVAEALRDRGIPYLFLTGYDRSAIPPGHADVPCLQKPADERRVVLALGELISE